jgi:hypothetical protein
MNGKKLIWKWTSWFSSKIRLFYTFIFCPMPMKSTFLDGQTSIDHNKYLNNKLKSIYINCLFWSVGNK